MQRDRGDAGALGDAPGLEVGEVVGVDALAHLDRERDVARGLHGALDDVAEQPGLPGQRRSPALAGDLRHGASEVQVDVVGAVFGDEHGDGLGDGLRVDAVELDRARRLGLVVRDEAHRLGRALDEGARRDHLADVEARAELAAEPAERRVRDAGHGREHDWHVELEVADGKWAA